MQPGDTRDDRRRGRDALEGAEPLPLDRPAVAHEPGRPRRVEPEPLDDRVARLARLARADAGALRTGGDACSRAAVAGRRSRSSTSPIRRIRTGIPAGCRSSQLTTGFDAERAVRRRRRAHRAAARTRPDADSQLRHAPAAREAGRRRRRRSHARRPAERSRASRRRTDPSARVDRRAGEALHRRCATSGAACRTGASTAPGSSGTSSARTA